LHKEAWLTKDTFDVLIKHCRPRPLFVPPEPEKRPRTPWTLPISVFKDYRPEYQELLVKCFEFDWQTIERPQIKVSTEDEVKDVTREAYPLIQKLHRRQSAETAYIDNKFSIKANGMREILSHVLYLIDFETLKPEQADLIFAKVNSGKNRANA